MKKNDIQKVIAKELDIEKDYTYLVLDMRNETPTIFRAWRENE